MAADIWLWAVADVHSLKDVVLIFLTREGHRNWLVGHLEVLGLDGDFKNFISAITQVLLEIFKICVFNF